MNQMEMVSLDQLVSANHTYRRFIKLWDFKGVEGILSTVKSLYPHEGYGVNRLFRCLLLQFMEDLSDRELEKFLTENVAGRWFCGFMLNEDTPDHTVFTRARAKIGTDLLATLFQELRNQLKKQGYMNEVFTFVDASHLIAKANLWLFIVLLSKGHKAFN